MLTILISGIVSAQEFDFGCNNNVHEYVNMFIEDAEDYGYDFSDKNIKIEWVYDVGYNAATNGRCTDRDNILINRDRWDNAEAERSNADIWRKYLIYHELGHALLNLRHICVEDSNRGEWANVFTTARVVYPDIMAARSECGSGLVAFRYDPWSNEEIFNESADRMFKLIEQDVDVCLTNKISNLIYD